MSEAGLTCCCWRRWTAVLSPTGGGVVVPRHRGYGGGLARGAVLGGGCPRCCICRQGGGSRNDTPCLTGKVKGVASCPGLWVLFCVYSAETTLINA